MATAMNTMSHTAICYLIIIVKVVYAQHLFQNAQREKDAQTHTVLPLVLVPPMKVMMLASEAGSSTHCFWVLFFFFFKKQLSCFV